MTPETKTAVQALHRLYYSHYHPQDPQQLVPPPMYKKALYYAGLSSALAFAVPSGEPYLPIGEDCLKNVFGWSAEDSLFVQMLVWYLGGAGFVTNSLFNIWAMLRYFENQLKPVSSEEQILYGAMRGWLYRFKQAALYGEAAFASLALDYVSFQEAGNKIDFWFINTVVIGFFIAFLSLDLFADSVIWFINTVKRFIADLYRVATNSSPSAEEELRTLIKDYYSQLHSYSKKNRFAENVEQPFEFKRATKDKSVPNFLLRSSYDSIPYGLGAALSFIFIGSRLGVCGEAFSAAKYLTDRVVSYVIPEIFFETLRPFSIGTIATLAALPPLALALKSFSALALALWEAAKCKSSQQIYSWLWWTLFLSAGFFVLGSWAGNVDLTWKYAHELAPILEAYFLMTATTSVVTNGFGVKNLTDDVVARFARFYRGWGSGDKYVFTNEEQFWKDFKKFLEVACQDNKKMVEFLLCFPDLISAFKRVGFNRFSEIAETVNFTYLEMKQLMSYLRLDSAEEIKTRLRSMKFSEKQIASFFTKQAKTLTNHWLFCDNNNEADNASEERELLLIQNFDSQIPNSLTAKTPQHI